MTTNNKNNTVHQQLPAAFVIGQLRAFSAEKANLSWPAPFGHVHHSEKAAHDDQTTTVAEDESVFLSDIELTFSDCSTVIEGADDQHTRGRHYLVDLFNDDDDYKTFALFNLHPESPADETSGFPSFQLNEADEVDFLQQPLTSGWLEVLRGLVSSAEGVQPSVKNAGDETSAFPSFQLNDADEVDFLQQPLTAGWLELLRGLVSSAEGVQPENSTAQNKKDEADDTSGLLFLVDLFNDDDDYNMLALLDLHPEATNKQDEDSDASAILDAHDDKFDNLLEQSLRDGFEELLQSLVSGASDAKEEDTKSTAILDAYDEAENLLEQSLTEAFTDLVDGLVSAGPKEEDAEDLVHLVSFDIETMSFEDYVSGPKLKLKLEVQKDEKDDGESCLSASMSFVSDYVSDAKLKLEVEEDEEEDGESCLSASMSFVSDYVSGPKLEVEEDEEADEESTAILDTYDDEAENLLEQSLTEAFTDLLDGLVSAGPKEEDAEDFVLLVSFDIETMSFEDYVSGPKLKLKLEVEEDEEVEEDDGESCLSASMSFVSDY
ncbi:hypothetical protein OC834_002538 [Tilletia horrida]|nr:hypothetical protein OC834_002538 [Tilletia horrida]